MKNMHVVMTGSYGSRRPVAVFENRGDAVRLACSINGCSASELSDSDIKTVPYVGETKVVDMGDLSTMTDVIINAYDRATRTNAFFIGGASDEQEA
ncbi:MAG: hypothetical protein IJ087_12565 [Eggerthellaceae bacterium]|nr:hypothetical protein [Eggerthellaceae bacterium]